MGEEKGKLEQSGGLPETPFAGSLAAEDGDDTWRPFVGGPTPEEKRFYWRTGNDNPDRMKLHNVAESKKITENPTFDICEHKIELLESYPKWRNIQRTLHWLNRLLSSNHNSMKLCVKRKKTTEQNSKSDIKAENNDFYQWKRGSFKNFLHRKNPKRERESKNDVKLKSRRGEEKKFKRKRKHKHRSWKNGREKLRSKWKGIRFERKHFLHKNATAILKPNSVLFDVEEIFLKRAKNRKVQSHDCINPKSNSKSVAVEGGENCEENSKYSKETSKGPEGKSMHSTEKWSGGTEGRGREADSKLQHQQQQQKAKAWPHFVYHRVSSNFLHPEQAGHSHKQSAYVAISVATSSKPELLQDIPRSRSVDPEGVSANNEIPFAETTDNNS